MIFVTVGTQRPFDRLVGGVAAWLEQHPGTEAFGQIGDTGLRPAFPHVDYLYGSAYEEMLARAGVVVSHAGIGIILTCWSLRKPLIVMPRSFALCEHRSDHQNATVKHVVQTLRLCHVQDVDGLHAALSRPWSDLIPCKRRSAHATQPPLRISDFVNTALRDHRERPGDILNRLTGELSYR